MINKNQANLMLLTLSDQMLNAAQRSDWEQLSLLEKQFQVAVKDYFEQSGLVVEHNQILARQLIEQQDRVQSLVKQAQKQIQRLMNDEERSNKAMHSYLNVENA
jgi:Na+/phosphate symporter